MEIFELPSLAILYPATECKTSGGQEAVSETTLILSRFTAACFGSYVRSYHQADELLKKKLYHVEHTVSFCCLHVCDFDVLHTDRCDKSVV
jgi:hypothetical protein